MKTRLVISAILVHTVQQHAVEIAMEMDLTPWVAIVANVHVYFQALDQDATLTSGGLDHNVEAGVDRVRVERDRVTCELSAIDPSNGIAGTLRLSKSTSRVELI